MMLESSRGLRATPRACWFAGANASEKLVLDCWNTNDWSGISGNLVKFGIGFVGVSFDLVFLFQVRYAKTDRQIDIQAGRKRRKYGESNELRLRY